jgi:hypothetical protein
MNNRARSIVAACALLGACEMAGSGTSAPRPAPAVPFQAQGEALRVEPQKAGEQDPFLSGVRTVGAIRLQVASFQSSDGRCSFEPANLVRIAYTSKTQFEPPEITRQVAFPGSLKGRTLNVQGRAFRVGRRCVAVADGVRSMESEAVDGGLPLAGPATTQDPKLERSGGPGARSEQHPAAAPDPAPVDLPALPSPAPVVKSTLRPSLPNPPTVAY